MAGITIDMDPVVVPVSEAAVGHRAQVTAYDLVQRLLSYLGGNPDAPAHADIRRAILDAYREMPSLHPWTYFVQIGRVMLNPSYPTGTITYDHTGGTYERQLTLAGGTWPTWAARGCVRINGITSYVDQRVSDTVLTLDPMQNPGVDLEAGTGYELVQDSYQLPIDFTVGDRGLPENAWGGMQYIRPADWLSMQRYSQTSGTAVFYTFTADPKAAGRLALRLYPPPTSAATLDFVYRRRCRDIKIWEQTKGKAAVTPGSSTITLSQGGVFAPAHVGSVIRLSDGAANPPTDLDGIYPYAVERTILQRISAAQALVDDAVEDAYSSVAYRISDPIDVEPTGMFNALYASSIRWLCTARNRKELGDATSNWRFALDLAKESECRDSALDTAGGMGGGYPIRLLYRGPITAS
jgi:hypothetical protein